MPNEIDQQDRVSNNNSGKGYKANHGGRRKGRAEQPMPDHDADQSERHRCQDNEGCPERAKLGDHQNVYGDQSHPKRHTHVTESDIGDFPLAVPKQGGL